MEEKEKDNKVCIAQIEQIIEQNKQEMIEALAHVIRLQSDQAEPVTAADGSVYPFGAGVQQAYETVLTMGHEMGFETLDVEHYGGHIDFRGSADTVLGIVGHLDVVPAAGNWDFDPYGGEVKDGVLYGRGTLDDKGPVIACLYAMKALKEAGFAPKSTVRLILGLDEETGWSGMERYLAQVAPPDFGFTPDGDFPLINGEKGNLIFEAARKFGKSAANKGLQLRSLKGGSAANSVPDAARAVVRNPEADYSKIKEEIAAFRAETGYKVNCKGVGKSLELTTVGRSAHGSTPEAGLNAISILMAFLGRLTFANEEHNDWIAFYNRCLGFDLCGRNLGIGFSDEISGNLALNVGMAEMEPEIGKLTINIRYPISYTQEQVFAGEFRCINTNDGYTFEDYDIKPGKTYTYYITGKFEGRDTIKSSTQSIKVMTVKQKKIKEAIERTYIRDLKGKRLSSKTVLMWKKAKSKYKVDGYVVLRSTNKYRNYKEIGTASKTKFVIKDKLQKGKKYYYLVQGYRVVNGKRIYTSGQIVSVKR